MQVRPPPQATPFKPPLGPKIPQREVQALIPRLKSAINDIDQLQGLIAAGGVDGSLPNWDTLLQRYSLLLGRINTLSQQLAVPSPTPITANQPFGQASSEPDPRAPPALSRYIVHPLNPLPPTAETSGIAQATFFEALNTVSIPHLATNTSGLLTNEVWDRTDRSALKAMDEEEVIRLRDRLRVKLEAGSSKSGKIKDMIDQVEEEYEWDTRIGGDEEGEEDAVGEEVEQGAKGDKIEEDDDDLFGDDGDDADDPVIVTSQSQSKAQSKEAKEPKAPSNPRPGWNLVDYVRFMDTGVEPQRPTSS